MDFQNPIRKKLQCRTMRTLSTAVGIRAMVEIVAQNGKAAVSRSTTQMQTLFLTTRTFSSGTTVTSMLNSSTQFMHSSITLSTSTRDQTRPLLQSTGVEITASQTTTTYQGTKSKNSSTDGTLPVQKPVTDLMVTNWRHENQVCSDCKCTFQDSRQCVSMLMTRTIASRE